MGVFLIKTGRDLSIWVFQFHPSNISIYFYHQSIKYSILHSQTNGDNVLYIQRRENQQIHPIVSAFQMALMPPVPRINSCNRIKVLRQHSAVHVSITLIASSDAHRERVRIKLVLIIKAVFVARSKRDPPYIKIICERERPLSSIVYYIIKLTFEKALYQPLRKKYSFSFVVTNSSVGNNF